MIMLQKSSKNMSRSVYDIRVYFETLSTWYSLHLVNDPAEAQQIEDAYILEGKQAEAVKRSVY